MFGIIKEKDAIGYAYNKLISINTLKDQSISSKIKVDSFLYNSKCR